MSEVASQILDSKPTEPAIVESTTQPAQTPEAKINPEEKVSSKMEILIRREAAAVQRERLAKDKEAEIEAKLAKIRDFESAKGNSKKALELLGLDYNELTQSLLKDGEIPPEVQIKKVEERFDTFLKSQEEAEQKRLSDQAREAEAKETKVIHDFKSEITTYLSDNKSRYELIDFEGHQDTVFDVIDEHYNRTLNPETGIGKIMTIAEAADKVEEFLEKKYERSKDLSKVKTLFGAVPKGLVKETVEQQRKQGQPPRTSPLRTLTNNNSATQAAPAQKRITDEDRIQKAIAYANSLRR